MKLLIDQQPAEQIHFANGVSLLECKNLIYKSMNLAAFIDYAYALENIQLCKPLKKSDLELFDHVDRITIKYLGICIKDSNVTRARVEACKRYGVEFVDRGGLIDHLNMVDSGDESHAYSY